MNKFVFLFILIVWGQAPSPIPLPSINMESMQGTWWTAIAFSTNITNQNFPLITCFEVFIDQRNETVYIDYSYKYNGENEEANFTASFSNSKDSIWNIEGQSEWGWIAFDVINQEWGMIGNMLNQELIILSRNYSLSPQVINAQIALAIEEGYRISPIHVYKPDNTECEEDFRFSF